DDPSVTCEFTLDEGAVAQLADAHRKIEALADDIDETIGEMEVELDLWVLGQELRQVWRDVKAAGGGRRGDLEHAARLGVAPADEVLRLRDQAQDVDVPLEITLARLGQRELAGRALKEP